MMTRDEFERTVRAMKAEGLSLSMPNLMLRTELPRHVIEDWLEEMDERARNPPPPSSSEKRKREEGRGGGRRPAKSSRGAGDEFVKSGARRGETTKLGRRDER